MDSMLKIRNENFLYEYIYRFILNQCLIYIYRYKSIQLASALHFSCFKFDIIRSHIADGHPCL